MALRALQVQASAQAGSQRLLDQEHSSRAGLNGGIDDAALLHLTDAAGNADDHAGLRGKDRCLGGGLEHLLKHTYGHFVVGNDALLQRAHGNHVAGGAVEHVPGGSAHLEDLAGVAVQRHNGRLPDHQALSVGIDQYIGGTQVNTQVVGK